MSVWTFLYEDLFPWPLASVLINTRGLWVEAGAIHPESSVCVLSASSETLKRRDYYMSVVFWINQSTVNNVWHMFGCYIPCWERRLCCFMSLLLPQQRLALWGIFQCFSWCDKALGGQIGGVLLFIHLQSLINIYSLLLFVPPQPLCVLPFFRLLMCYTLHWFTVRILTTC